MTREWLMDEGSIVVFGYDRPFKTFFAQLYTNPDDWPHGVPAKTVGYHPIEQELSPSAEHGVYPADLSDLGLALIAWEISPKIRAVITKRLESVC